MPRDIALSRARIGHRPLRRGSLLDRIAALVSIARQRRRLAELDPHLLRDVGITPRQAMDEAGRAFWDAPRHWRG